MSDRLEILVPDPSYDREGSPDEVRDELMRLVREVFPDSTVREGDAGRGASWPVFVLTIAGVLFFSGKKIDENLDAWLNLAKRFRGLVSRIRARFGGALVDERGAQLLAVSEITGRRPSEVTVLASSAAEIGTSDTIGARGLEAAPHRLYVFVIQVDEIVHVYGVDFRGRPRFHHRYRVCPPLEDVEVDGGRGG